MKWSENYLVNNHDLDLNGIARTSVLMRSMQECANAQCRNMGPSNESLREEGKAFLLSRFAAGFYATVNAYDALTTESWGVESKGFSFYRCYRILRGSEVVAEATSVWALVDIASRRPVRVSEYRPGFEYDEMLSLELPTRIVFPQSTSPRLVKEHVVTYGETDQNKHMNNTRYVDMLCDCLPMEGKRVSRLSINFLSEAKYGDTVNIYALTQKDDTLFRTVRSDGKTNIEAHVTLCDV